MLIGQITEDTINLSKGIEISLAKAEEKTGTSIDEVTIGLGWDRQPEEGEEEFDADSVALLLDKDGKMIPGITPLIFYNNMVSEDGNVVHSKDNRNGEGEGYDETIKMKLKQLDPRIGIVIIGLSIHNAENNSQNFGQINNAMADVVNDTTGEIAVHIDLTKNLSSATGLDAVKFSKEADDSWSCKYVGQKTNGLAGLLEKYGIPFKK